MNIGLTKKVKPIKINMRNVQKNCRKHPGIMTENIKALRQGSIILRTKKRTQEIRKKERKEEKKGKEKEKRKKKKRKRGKGKKISEKRCEGKKKLD